MKLLFGFEQPHAYRGGFVSIGNFDGVHRGHRRIAGRLVDRARSLGIPAVVFTFHPHPTLLLRPQAAPPSLCTIEHKAELLGECGVDVVIAYPTDLSLLGLTPREFFVQIVLGELDTQGLVEGPNFYFGRNRTGSIETLRALCEEFDCALEVVEPVVVGTQTVSSSVVRTLVTQGKLAEAVELLGHAYRIRGRVCRGAERGQSLGFPTANLDTVGTVLPADGVYAGMARTGRSGATWYPAAINVGPNPTFGETRRKVEVHLVGYAGNLYGEEVDVDFFSRLRDTLSFADVAALQRQVKRDIEGARELAKTFRTRGEP